MGILEDQAVNVGVSVEDDAIVSTNLNLALIFTDETPLVLILTRTKEYFQLSDIAIDWGTTSKVYKAATPHFSQQPHVGSIKIGWRAPKGAVKDDESYAVVSNVCTVTSVAHGLSIDEEVTVLDSSGSPLLNGVKKVTSVPTSGSFTFAAAGVDDESGTLDYHTGDASLTVAADAIWNFDSNYFHWLSIFKSEANIKEIAAWIETKPLIYAMSVEYINIYDSNESSDLLSDLSGLGYNNTYLAWYHRAGKDGAGVSILVASEIATVTQADHGLRVDDLLTIVGASPAGLNGDKTVLTVVDKDNFTYDATGVVDGAATGTINYFARYGFIETAIQSRQLGRPEGIGGTSWAYKNYVGFEETPNDILSPSQALVIATASGGGKNGNFYKDLQGSGGRLQYGRMVSGREIKTQAVSIWLKIRCQEAGLQKFIETEQFVYDNASLTEIANAFQGPLGQQLTRKGITAYDTNNNWLIEYANAEDVPLVDKQQNIMRFNIKYRIGTEILSLAVNIQGIQ